MKANYSIYNHEDSDSRIREIINSADYEYEEKDSIPNRDTLTFTNGYYVKCSAMFVDIRGSSELSQKYSRPTLARIFRSYISELVAVLRGNSSVCEIMIEGDCVWGIFDTRYKQDINELFGDAARVVSLVNILNWRLSQKNIAPVSIGIGLDYGRALMIKGGYRGSGINEAVWMGDVVSSAARLCSYGSKSLIDKSVMLSEIFNNNLYEENKKLVSWNGVRDCYHASIINRDMNKWLTERNKGRPK